MEAKEGAPLTGAVCIRAGGRLGMYAVVSASGVNVALWPTSTAEPSSCTPVFRRRRSR
jgi:hypothetical protein